MLRQKGAEPLRRRDIGAARVVRPALFMRQMGVPVADQSVSHPIFRSGELVEAPFFLPAPNKEERPFGRLRANGLWGSLAGPHHLEKDAVDRKSTRLNSSH